MNLIFALYFLTARNVYVSRGWMLSRDAHFIYRVATGLSVMLFILEEAVLLRGEISKAFLLMLQLLFIAGALGTATILIAMTYFLLGFDTSSSFKKTLWFLALYLFFPVGPPLYYFFVYSRSHVLRMATSASFD